MEKDGQRFGAQAGAEGLDLSVVFGREEFFNKGADRFAFPAIGLRDAGEQGVDVGELGIHGRHHRGRKSGGACGGCG